MLPVPWTASHIRFCEKRQLIDVGDCLAVLHASEGAAKVAMTRLLRRYQSKNRNSENLQDATNGLLLTAKVVGCDYTELVKKVHWSNARYERQTVAVKHMKIILEKRCNMPQANDLASILNVDKLSVALATIPRGAVQADLANENNPVLIDFQKKLVQDLSTAVVSTWSEGLSAFETSAQDWKVKIDEHHAREVMRRITAVEYTEVLKRKIEIARELKDHDMEKRLKDRLEA